MRHNRCIQQTPGKHEVIRRQWLVWEAAATAHQMPGRCQCISKFHCCGELSGGDLKEGQVLWIFMRRLVCHWKYSLVGEVWGSRGWIGVKMVYFEPKVLCCSGNRRISLRGDAADVNGAKMPPFHKAVNEEGRPGVIYLSYSLEEPVGSRYQQFCNSTRSGKNSFLGAKISCLLLTVKAQNSRPFQCRL